MSSSRKKLAPSPVAALPAARKIIFFDTETTGLPADWKTPALLNSANWPDLVSICWLVFSDADGYATPKKENHIIKPDGWIIPDSAAAIHGITQARAEAEGKPLEDILDLFKADLVGCWRLVAHNMNFDSNVMLGAYKWRLGQDPSSWWPFKAEFCTMLKTVGDLRIPVAKKNGPTGNPFKYPKLDELWAATFDSPVPANAHSADRDVEVLAKIYWRRWPILKV